jgi:hypothetical protein
MLIFQWYIHPLRLENTRIASTIRMGLRKTSKLKPKDSVWVVGICLFIAFLAGRCSTARNDSRPAPGMLASTEDPPAFVSEPEPSTPPTTAPAEGPTAAASERDPGSHIKTPRLLAPDGSGIDDPAKWQPKTVKLTADVEMIVVENGKYKGKEKVRTGTILTLSAIKRDTVYVEYRKTTNQISAALTDLADQMAQVQLAPP